MKFKLNNFERAIFSTALSNSMKQFDPETRQASANDCQGVQVHENNTEMKKQIEVFVERYSTVNFVTNEEQLARMKKEIENGLVTFSNKALLAMFKEEIDIC